MTTIQHERLEDLHSDLDELLNLSDKVNDFKADGDTVKLGRFYSLFETVKAEMKEVLNADTNGVSNATA